MVSYILIYLHHRAPPVYVVPEIIAVYGIVELLSSTQLMAVLN